MDQLLDQENKQDSEDSSGSSVNQSSGALSNHQLNTAENGSSGSSGGTSTNSGGVGGNYSFGLGGNDNKDDGSGSKKGKSDKVGKGYTSGTASNSAVGITAKIASKGKSLAGNKKALAGGATAGVVVTITIAAFFGAAALKIEHIVDNLENRFFASSENAVENETTNLYKGYLEKIMPSYGGSCGINVDKHCSENILGNSPVDNLYRSWSQNKLEDKLASDYGIEIQYDSGTRTYYLKAPGATDTPEGDPVGTDADVAKGDFSELDNEFTRSDRTEVRQTIKDAIKNETSWKQVMYRYKVGRLLEEKYGIKRCIIACGSVRDPLANFANRKKNAAELWLVQRVITPRFQSLGIVLQCILSSSCDSTEKSTDSTSTPCSNDCDMDGADETGTETQIRSGLETLAASYGITDSATIQKMISTYDSIAEKGYANAAVEAALSKLGLDFGEEGAEDSDPVGWIQTAATLISAVKTAGPAIKTLSYATDSAAAVQLYEMYNTYADETKTGNVDATEYGSFVNALGPGDHSDTSDPNQVNDPEVGGTSSAEGTPLYANLMDGTSPSPNQVSSNSSLLGNLFSPTAFAAGNSSSSSSGNDPNPYLCNDNKTVPAGQLVCPVEKFGVGNSFLNTVSAPFQVPPLSLIGDAASLINKFSNVVNDLIGYVLNLLPFFKTLTAFVGNVIKPFENYIVSELIPDPFSTNMSGGRTFDMLAAGADSAGSSYAQNGIGGVALTPAQSNTIVSEQLNEEKQQFQSQPLFARLFSTSSPYSLISRLADDIPLGATSSVNSVASLFTNPISSIGHSFSTIFSSNAWAAGTPQPDPFGITQYGYPPGSIPDNPEQYWNQNCVNPSDPGSTNVEGGLTQQYNQNAANNIDPNTGQAMNAQDPSAPNDGTDPCLLIQAAVGSAGAIFNQSLLTPDDLGDISGSGTGSSAGSTAANANIYWVGDSLSVGMESAGLQSDLTAKGYTVSKIEATVGDNVADAIPKVQADATQVSSSGTVVVELGTNDCSLSGAPTCESTQQFEGQIQNMISTIRSSDPNAVIYWVNIFTTKGPEYQSINQAITAESSALNYNVIDWANEATTNPSKYSFDTALGVHQTTGTGYQNMANFVTSQVSSAPTQTASNGQNMVAQAILGNQKSTPSPFSGLANIFSKLMSSFVSVDKRSVWLN